MIKLSDYVVKFLEDKGLKHIFLLCGGGAMHLNDSFGKSKKIEYIPVLHEQAASIAAEAYSRCSENFGSALLTTGPGGTNAVTGVAGAWADSIPCFFISGQVKRSDLIGDQNLRISGFQEAEIVKIVSPITKYAVLVTDPLKIKYHLEKAWQLMISGRPGPVWLDIPLDVQDAKINEQELIPFNPEEIVVEQDSDAVLNEKIRATATLLRAAERPVLLAGNGIRISHAMEEFYELIKKMRIPLLTTWGAVDFIEDDYPLFFGRPNMLGGNRHANFILQNADVLLTVGARLGVQQIGYNHKAFARETKLIMVDIDKYELEKKTLNPKIRIHSDAKRFLEGLNNELGEGIMEDGISGWINWCRERKKRYPVVLPEYFKQKKYANSYVFVDELSTALSPDDVIIPSSSATAYVCTSQAFKLKKGQRFFTSRGLASMGWDLPSAIGACLASGRKRTICITGDGSIQMNIQELQTIISKKLPIKIFVLNNGGYLTIKSTQKNFFSCHYVGCNDESGLCLPSITKIAKAYGFPTEIIRNNSQIKPKLMHILSTEGPFLCEIVMDPDQPVIPKLSSMIEPDGTIVSKPLEDLYPFLDREEFRQNMIIKPFDR